MRALFLAALLALVAPAVARAADGATIVARDLPGRRRAHDRGRVGAVRLRPGRVPLAGRRQRALPHPCRRRSLELVAAGGARGRGPARPGQPGDDDPQGLAARQSLLGRCVRPRGVPRGGRCAQAARLVRVEPGRAGVAPGAVHDRYAPDRAATGVGGERGDHPRRPAVRALGCVCGRPSHGRLERLHPEPVRRDRARDRAVPRPRKRLERHRLQLPRRQIRPGLRRPCRRDRAQRDRCARGGVQYRLHRRCRDRQLLCDEDLPCCVARARRPAGVAPRRRPRRPAEHADMEIGRKPRVPGRQGGEAAGDLRASRHRTDQLPRRRPVLEAARHRAGGRAHRAAQAVRAPGGGRSRRHRSGSPPGSPPPPPGR